MQNKPRRATGAAARAVGLPRGAATAVLLCALLAPCDAQFTSFTSGASCEANGADSITTLADCSAAAAALGLSDTTAEDDGRDGHRGDPPYCYFWRSEFAQVQSLKFNAAGTKYGRSTLNTGDCDNYDQSQGTTCVCSAD